VLLGTQLYNVTIAQRQVGDVGVQRVLERLCLPSFFLVVAVFFRALSRLVHNALYAGAAINTTVSRISATIQSPFLDAIEWWFGRRWGGGWISKARRLAGDGRDGQPSRRGQQADHVIELEACPLGTRSFWQAKGYMGCLKLRLDLHQVSNSHHSQTRPMSLTRRQCVHGAT
jgi:hypothetical protein